MMVWKYPQEVHDFVKKWAPKLRDRDLAEACNRELGTSFTEKTMKGFRNNHKYRNGKKQWTSEEYWKYQRYYPQGMYEFVRDNSWGVPSAAMAEMVNERFGTTFTASGMKQFRQRHGIKSGLTGWYQRGRSPANKGKKLEEYVGTERAAEIKEQIRATQFKKGEAPANELPIGSVVTNRYGYKLRKVRMKGSQWERWEFLHRAVWEEHNGPIPEGMLVAFRDGDRSNCSIENLVLVTPGENAYLTKKHWRFRDPEMTDAALSTIRLKKALEDKRGPKNPEGPELRMKREAAGITPKEAAAKLGVSVQTIKRIEKGDAGEQSAAMKAYRALLNTGEHDGKDSEQENGSGDLHDAEAGTSET